MKYSLPVLIFVFGLIVISRLLPFYLQDNQPVYKPLGGVVPHHLFVRDIITNFFQRIKTDGINQVIVIGPNHLELGEEKVIYNPGFEDQSLTSVLPYIRHTFPSSEIIPIVLKRELSLAECTKLADELLQLSGNNLLIASIDFSHYLPSSQAEANDGVILSMIRNRDYQAILKLNSDYLDSPPALVVALMYYESRGLKHMTILDNTNSGARGNQYAPTTSYFSLIFYGQD
jgi:predicted class III extradiol MEMO1 family dioxygenase